MCLAIPGQVVEILEVGPPFLAGMVSFGGVRRPVNLACVPEALPGDYVLVHAGVAISRIDAEEAAQVLAEIEALGIEDEWPESPETTTSSGL